MIGPDASCLSPPASGCPPALGLVGRLRASLPLGDEPFPYDLDHGRGLIQKAGAAPSDHCRAATQFRDGVLMLGHFVSRRCALDGQHPPTHRRQGQAPGGEPIKRGNGSRGHYPGRRYRRATPRNTVTRSRHHFLGPGTYHPNPVRQPQLGDDFGEEPDSPSQWFNEYDGQVHTGHSQHDTGQTST